MNEIIGEMTTKEHRKPLPPPSRPPPPSNRDSNQPAATSFALSQRSEERFLRARGREQCYKEEKAKASRGGDERGKTAVRARGEKRIARTANGPSKVRELARDVAERAAHVLAREVDAPYTRVASERVLPGRDEFLKRLYGRSERRKGCLLCVPEFFFFLPSKRIMHIFASYVFIGFLSFFFNTIDRWREKFSKIIYSG